jgi:energy-coupling factor transporter transmembrane protein EcfT
MWILSFLPDSFLLFIVNTILIAGIIGTVVSFFFINRLARWFPSITPYYWLLQILSIVVLIAGVYFKGGYSVEQEWRDRVAALEAKIAIAEEKSKAANNKLNEVVKSKTKVIHDTKVITYR